MRTITGNTPPRIFPSASDELSVAGLRRRERRLVTNATVAFVLLTIIAGLATKSLGFLGLLACTVLVLMAWLTYSLWKHPAMALYVLVGAATILATYSNTTSRSTDYITKFLPIFEDLNTITGSRIAAVSPLELFMVLALVIWLLKTMADRALRFDWGTLMKPLGLYMLMVIIGEFHGLLTGSDFRFSLEEIRAQVYMLVAYVLTCNVIQHRKQVAKLLWVIIIGAGLRGIEGSLRYIFTIRGSGPGINELYPHEQAFFFNAFLTIAILLPLYGGTRRMKRTVWCFLPFVTLASLANNRRAAVLAFLIALVILLVLMLITDVRRRRVAGWIIVALAVGLPPYYLAFQRSSSSWAMPARAIASNFHPDARDASSDAYRVNEDKDIMLAMRSSPVIGTGFGRPMQEVFPLDSIDKIYPLEPYLPHNSILWIWMRLGSVGYLIFWLLIGTAVAQSVRLVLRRDPWMQLLGLFVVLMIVQEVILGYLDIQWTSPRNLIFVGFALGLISVVARLGNEGKSPDRSKDKCMHVRSVSNFKVSGQSFVVADASVLSRVD